RRLRPRRPHARHRRAACPRQAARPRPRRAVPRRLGLRRLRRRRRAPAPRRLRFSAQAVRRQHPRRPPRPHPRLDPPPHRPPPPLKVDSRLLAATQSIFHSLDAPEIIGRVLGVVRSLLRASPAVVVLGENGAQRVHHLSPKGGVTTTPELRLSTLARLAEARD